MKKHFVIAILLIFVFTVSISTVLAETPIAQSFDTGDAHRRCAFFFGILSGKHVIFSRNGFIAFLFFFLIAFPAVLLLIQHIGIIRAQS